MRAMVGTLRFVAGVVISIIMAVSRLSCCPWIAGADVFFIALARFWARTVLFACGVRVRVSGLDRVDFSKNYVYVSNHASMLDIPVILAGIPDQISGSCTKRNWRNPRLRMGTEMGKLHRHRPGQELQKR